MNRLLPFVPLLLLPLLLGACSSYPRDFRAAASAVPSESALGAWKGHWISESNGHRGPLWCIVSATPGQPGSTDFRYRAGWGVLQFGDYVHRVDVTPGPDGIIELDHAMELPGGFGRYRIEGQVTPEAFRARFQSDRGDRGVMELERP